MNHAHHMSALQSLCSLLKAAELHLSSSSPPLLWQTPSSSPRVNSGHMDAGGEHTHHEVNPSMRTEANVNSKQAVCDLTGLSSCHCKHSCSRVCRVSACATAAHGKLHLPSREPTIVCRLGKQSVPLSFISISLA